MRWITRPPKGLGKFYREVDDRGPELDGSSFVPGTKRTSRDAKEQMFLEQRGSAKVQKKVMCVKECL